MNNGGISQLFIDVSPFPKGKKGIVRVQHDPDTLTVIADSFEDYLPMLMDKGYDFVARRILSKRSRDRHRTTSPADAAGSPPIAASSGKLKEDGKSTGKGRDSRTGKEKKQEVTACAMTSCSQTTPSL